MTTFPEPLSDKIFVRRAVEAAIRIGLVALLVAWCFQIVRPFIVPVVWGIIIAVAAHPGYRRLESILGGRRTIAATLFTLLMLILLIGPTVMLAGTLVESAQGLAADLTDGTLSIPAPPDSIGSWPIIGEPLERFWRLASVNLGAALAEIRPQIAAFGRWLLATGRRARPQHPAVRASDHHRRCSSGERPRRRSMQRARSPHGSPANVALTTPSSGNRQCVASPEAFSVSL